MQNTDSVPSGFLRTAILCTAGLLGKMLTFGYTEHIKAWYAQRRIEILPRLRGENGHYINYCHVIDNGHKLRISVKKKG